MLQDVHQDEHDDQVNRGDAEANVKNLSENVYDVGLQSTFQLQLCVCQLVIWVETIVDKREEDNKWICNHNQNYDRDNVLIVSPILKGVADIATQSSGHFTKASEECGRQVRNDVQCGEPNHHSEREYDEPFSIFSTTGRTGFRKVGDEEKHEEREQSQEEVCDTPAATELPFSDAAHVLVGFDLGAERLPLASIDLL